MCVGWFIRGPSKTSLVERARVLTSFHLLLHRDGHLLFLSNKSTHPTLTRSTLWPFLYLNLLIYLLFFQNNPHCTL